MAQHYRQDSINPVVEAIAEAVAAELQEQPWWKRYKGTVLIVLQAVAWVGAYIPVYLNEAPTWLALVVGGVASFAAAVINFTTRDGVTPSTAPQLARQHQQQVAREKALQEAQRLPVYSGSTSRE